MASRRLEQPLGVADGDTEDAECVICHAYVHEAAVECACCPGRRTCLRHAHNLCECPPARWRLAFRHSLAELETLHAEVAARLPEGMASSLCCPNLIADVI